MFPQILYKLDITILFRIITKILEYKFIMLGLV